jgi:hypothetical protein
MRFDPPSGAENGSLAGKGGDSAAPTAKHENAAGTDFRLVPCLVDRLPALAWLAVVHHTPGEVRLFHGPQVEVTDSFFIEGAWSGPFDDGEIATARTVFGSAGVLRGGTATFVSSVATTDYLYHRQLAHSVLVSNSLPLLLAWAGDRLDPQCDRYSTINASITDGIDKYIRTIPTLGGSVARLMHRNLIVSEEGMHEVEKPLPPRFNSYDAYFNYINEEYENLTLNMRSVSRNNRLRVYSTQSRGYDSTAVNAIASRYGLDGAFTVTKGKAKGQFATTDAKSEVNDDGTLVCEALGIQCFPIDRRAFEKERSDEYLYYATLDDNGDMNLAEIIDRVNAPCVLLTGCLGEMWYTRTESRTPDITSTLKRWDLGNHGLTEVRLNAGIVQVAPIYIGAVRRDDIVRITESSKMDPWRLGVVYDRPIPRRIAEDAGVPRELFGQTKMASVVEFSTPHTPFGRKLRQEYMDFLVEHDLRSRAGTYLFPVVHFINTCLHFSSPTRLRAIYFLERAVSKVIGRSWSFAKLWSDLDGTIFCFAVNKRIDDYLNAINSVNSSSRFKD